jgi:MFS family permease
MQISQFSASTHAVSRTILGNAALIVNIFAWYSFATAILRQIIESSMLTSPEVSLCYTASFLGAVISLFSGAALASKVNNRRRLLSLWIVTSASLSVFPLLLQTATFLDVLVVAFMVSGAFGLGVPACMALFAENTIPEDRGRTSAGLLLVTFLATFGLRFVMTDDMVVNSIVLLSWRIASLVAIPFVKPQRKNAEGNKTSFVSILASRPFCLYLAPWAIFSLVNYFAWSISMSVLGTEFVQLTTIAESVIVGVFAVAAGFMSDIVGRKRTLMAGFVLFGLGYAILGVAPSNVLSWYFYMVVDGVALGIFYVIFLFTVWGDLAHEKPSEKHYAIGILPYSLSSFLHLTVGSVVAEAISPYAIFSFAAFFLFLAVVPLMYAPETLPEKTLKDRELHMYVEKAMQKKEKYA